jgi:ATP-dependent helicase/nuclease subunit A
MTGSRESPLEAWCEMVRRGLIVKTGGLERATAPYGPIEIWQDRSTKAAGAFAPSAPLADPCVVPAWLLRPVEPEPEPIPPLRPSSAIGAADRVTRPGDGPYAPQARLRGTLIHALLERLPGYPSERWEVLARAYVEARAPRFEAPLKTRVVSDTLRVLRDPALAPLFAPGTRAEAPIAGFIDTRSGPVAVSGQIDRLAIGECEVLLADFKTTSRPPEAHETPSASHVAQLALYRALLSEIYPDRAIRAFLVWTSGPLIRELSETELESALLPIKAA